MRFRRYNKMDIIKYSMMTLFLFISLGYALLTTNLNITGTSNFARTTWNIHFENLVPSTNMALGANDSAAAITSNKTTEVTYALNFTEPGQYYEFLVDVKNDGTIDGMVNLVTSTIKVGNGNATAITTNPSNLPSYLDYSATYSDGVEVAQYHLLEAGEKETFKVRIAFRTDIEATDLPGSDQALEFTFGVEYVQRDENAVVSHPALTVYAANIHNHNMATIANKTNTTVAWVGEAVPNGITTYQTPALAMAALKTATGGSVDRPFFIRHTIDNNIITQSDVGFVITNEMVVQAEADYIASCNSNQECIDSYQGATAGTYYLVGEPTYEYKNSSWSCISKYSDGNGHCIAPSYSTNITTLTNAFGSSNCSDNSNYYMCSITGLSADANNNGYVTAHDGDYMIEVADRGYSGCYDY